MPGFGIVAAVLGIVVTMQAINGPVEEIGHKVGAALVYRHTPREALCLSCVESDPTIKARPSTTWERSRS